MFHFLDKLLRSTIAATKHLGPKYICDLVRYDHHDSSRPLKVVWGMHASRVPLETETKRGEALFSIYAPHIWNKLPENCRFAATQVYLMLVTACWRFYFPPIILLCNRTLLLVFYLIFVLLLFFLLCSNVLLQYVVLFAL